MLRRSTIPTTPFRQLPALVLLVTALLWAQLLGLAHGVLHAGAAMRAPDQPAALQASTAPAAGLLAHLLLPAGDESQCRLYDQLGHGGPLLQLALPPAVLPPLLLIQVVCLPQRPQPTGAFDARGPPASR